MNRRDSIKCGMGMAFAAFVGLYCPGAGRVAKAADMVGGMDTANPAGQWMVFTWTHCDGETVNVSATLDGEPIDPWPMIHVTQGGLAWKGDV